MEEKLTFKKNLIIILLCLISIITCVILNYSLIYSFSFSIFFTIIFLYLNGFNIKKILISIKKDLIHCWQLYIIILSIGGIVSMWISSGIIPTLITLGISFMKGSFLLPLVFLITGIISFFMGTALGTISTIGIAILGIGQSLNLPTNILLGATISGAFIADKIAPISGLLNLTLKSYNVTYKNFMKKSLYTLVPTIFLSIIFYYIIGQYFNYNIPENLSIINELKIFFVISPWILIIPILIIILSFVTSKTHLVLSAGIFLGFITTIFIQKISFVKTFYYLLFGYNLNSNSNLEKILKGGGVLNMIEVLSIVILVITLSSILENSNIINSLTYNYTNKISSKKNLILKTEFLASIMTIFTCDQTIGIVLPSKILKKQYKRHNISQEIFARTISDSSTIIAPLMPWNVNAIIIYSITNISAIEYAPYSLLCFLFPIVSFLVFSITKK